MSSRNLKAECGECGFVLRASRLHLTRGELRCPLTHCTGGLVVGGVPRRDASMLQRAKDVDRRMRAIMANRQRHNEAVLHPQAIANGGGV